MLNAMYELGNYIVVKDNMDKMTILLDSYRLRNSQMVIYIDMIKENERILYDKISLEEYQKDKNLNYFYKKGSSRGTNITPTALITDDVKKTFNGKLCKWFKNFSKEDKLIEYTNSVLVDQFDEILSDIKEKYKFIEKDKNNNVILSIRYFEDKYLYMNEFNIFKDLLFVLSEKKCYELGSKKSVGISTCYLCEETKEVYGLVPSGIGLTFGTGDKPGNIPEFDVVNQWKQSGICYDCALKLEAGMKYIETYLHFNEYNLNYYVIPKVFFNQKKVFDTLDVFFREYENKIHIESLTTDERQIVAKINKLNENLEFKYLYFERSNNSFNILGYVESVIPSWLKKVYDEQSKINKLSIFGEDALKENIDKKIVDSFIVYLNSKEHFNTKNWYLKILRDFFPYKTDNKYYVDLVTSIMGQKSINFNFLLSNMMKKIRSNWMKYDKENFDLKINVYKSLMLILLFKKLNLFNGEEKMSLENMDSENLLDMLTSPDKKACFLLGALTRKLTNIQYMKLNSKPFIKKLWDLNLSYEKIQKVYAMLINKLREYGYTYSDMEEEITYNLLKSENDWNLNKDEISYYFVLGFTIGGKFKLNEEEVDENE